MPDASSQLRRTANFKQLPTHLHAPFEALKKHEAKIKKLLSTKTSLEETFLEDPVAALEKAGIPVESALFARSSHRAGSVWESFRGAGATLFANGSTVQPRVGVHITA